MTNTTQSKNEFLAETMRQKDIEISRLRNELSAKQEEISDLTERLKTALKMNSIKKNQELMTLKSDISQALVLEYVDFLASKEEACSEGLFGHYRSTLSRVFKLLKRFGITCGQS